MIDFDKMNNKDTILNITLQTLTDIIDDIPLIDEKTRNVMKELAKIYMEEVGNKYSLNEIVEKFMSPEMTLQEFKAWIKSKEELAKSMGL